MINFTHGPEIVGDILVFLAFTLMFTVVFYGLAAVGGSAAPEGMRLYITALMWSPGWAALVTTWLRGRNFRAFGWGWGETRWNLVGYLLPLGYAALAYVIVWGAGWGSFADEATVADLAAKLGWRDAGRWTVILGYGVLAGTAGMASSVSTALGEEIGWRGFLVPRMVAQLGFTPAVLIVGAIWTLWHMPIILFGSYNQGAPIWITVFCFTALVMGMNMVAAWLRLRSRSLWPCVILHAGHNLFIQSIFTPLTGARGEITAYAIGEFGLCVPALGVLLGIYFWTKRQRALAAWNAA